MLLFRLIILSLYLTYLDFLEFVLNLPGFNYTITYCVIKGGNGRNRWKKYKTIMLNGMSSDSWQCVPAHFMILF